MRSDHIDFIRVKFKIAKALTLFGGPPLSSKISANLEDISVAVFDLNARAKTRLEKQSMLRENSNGIWR